MIDTLLDCAVLWVPALIAGAGAGFWAGYATGKRERRRKILIRHWANAREVYQQMRNRNTMS